MRIAVAIATTGRAEILDRTIACWAAQSRPHDALVLSVAAAEDVGARIASSDNVRVLTGPKGLTKQRNRILDHLKTDYDLIVFADDDYVPSKRFLEIAESIMKAHADIAILSGWVIADGIHSQGISFEEAADIVKRRDSEPAALAAPMFEITHAYGCNMIVRPAANPSLRFDERLPLYGWLEDLDYSRRMAPHGRVMRADALIGVHMGVKGGRQSGLRLGYSQVANPMYFVSKRTMPVREAFFQIVRNVGANALKALAPEPWVDRGGRLRGNLLALADALVGRQSPERINEL